MEVGWPSGPHYLQTLLRSGLGTPSACKHPSAVVPPFPHLEDASENSSPVGLCQGVMS